MALDLRPLTLPELLDRSFSTYKRHVWLFVGIMAVPGAFGFAYALLMQVFQLSGGAITPGMAPDVVFRRMVPMLVGALVFLIIYVVVYSFALGAITIAVARIYNDEPVTVAETYRAMRARGWRLVLLLLWATLRVFLAWFGLMVLVGIISAISAQLSPIVSGLIFVVGMFASFALVVLFAVRYGVCVPAAVLENLSPNRALARSVNLTQGHRGRIFLILLCAVVITYATALLLQAPFLFGAMMAGPGTMTAFVLNVVGAALGTIGSTFSGPIMIIGLAMAYYDLRIRKEALDLQMMLEALDAPRG
jgi:hypothetical protein